MDSEAKFEKMKMQAGVWYNYLKFAYDDMPHGALPLAEAPILVALVETASGNAGSTSTRLLANDWPREKHAMMFQAARQWLGVDRERGNRTFAVGMACEGHDHNSGDDLLIVQFKMLDDSATIVIIGKIVRGEGETQIVNVTTDGDTWDTALLDTFIQTYNAEINPAAQADVTQLIQSIARG